MVEGTKALSVSISHAIFSDRAFVLATGDEYFKRESKMAPGNRSLLWLKWRPLCFLRFVAVICILYDKVT